MLIVAVPDPDAVAGLIREHAPSHESAANSSHRLAETTSVVG